MGAKTVKRLAILVTTILIAGLSIFFIQRYQVERMDRSVLAQAAQAEKNGNFEEAAPLYQEHLEVAPDDWEAKLKYADVLLKGPKNPARQELAAQLYDQYVTRFPANNSARHRLAELEVEMGRYRVARPRLENLLKSEPKDGAVRFLLGRCQEAMDDPSGAEKSFRLAYEYGAPQRLEAYWRRATLLRKQLEKQRDGAQKVEAGKVVDDADNDIKKMVDSDPENYQVYLERGRYRRQFARTPKDREDAKQDFLIALKKGPNDPKVYTELAELARSSKNDEEARRVIEAGLKVSPNDPTLHLERAMLEMPGSIDKAITSLRHSVELLSDQPMLRLRLANLLAQRGDTPELLRQIEELKRLNLPSISIGLLEARYQIASNEWKKAIQSLVRLQPLVEQSPEAKAQVHDLLAQCYHHLGDRVREREEYERSSRANPLDVQARWGLATILADQGEIDNAIKEYRQLLDQLQREQPEAELAPIRGQLVRLLVAKRDWTEVGKLVKESAPQSSDRVTLETELLVAQDKTAEAQDLLEKARSRTPRDVDLWVKSAELLRRQRKFDDARKLLDQAEKSLGDSVALRLERSRLLTVQGGADLPKALAALAENSASFSRADRRRLLEVLAKEAVLLNDRTLVTDLWSQVAKLDPNDLEPQFHLFDLALQGKNKADIENRLNEIKRVEGAEGSNGKYREALYIRWQSANTTDLKEQANLRNTARLLLKDLRPLRPDWPQIPRTLAELALADLSQPDLSKEEKTLKINEAADRYREAIKLGQRDTDGIRRATDLLYATGRNKEAISLWTELSTTSAAGSALLLQCSLEALRHRDLEGALELARKAKAANPNDFQVRLWLARRLIDKQLLTDAENELREAVAAVPLDPARRIALVEFLTVTKIKEAEKAVLDAESALREKPLGPARCCEVLGRAYKTAAQDDQKSKFWLDEAGRWYVAAQRAQPNDLMVTRLYFDFLFGSGQIKELELQLKTIPENNDPKNPEKRALARHTLFLTLLASRDAEKRREARDVLEELVGTNMAGPEDRFRLALMYSKDGNWAKAHEQYRTLVAQTENTSDLEVFNRRPDYIAQFIDELLKRCQGDQRQEVLIEAQDQIDKLRALRPDAFNVVAFEARLYKAQDQMDKAIELIRAIAKRPNLSDPAWQLLANLADELGETKLAEELLRQLLERSDRPENRLALAKFLGRHGRVKEAIDLCEQLWNVTTNPEEFANGTLDVLSFPDGDRDKTQLYRVASWMEKGLKKQPKSPRLTIALASLRERQGRFQDAQALYTQGVQQGSDNWKAMNNLAWLMALRNDDLNVALGHINSAIKLGGEVAELLDTRGVVYTKLRKSQDALTDLDKATKLDPSGPKYFHLAQAYLQAGDKQAAAESWDKARSKGLTPDRLHALEVTAYQQVLGELGTR